MRQYESYKDSGIQWLGKIPSHWISRKLRYSCVITDGTHYSPATTESGMPYITVSNVHNDIIDLEHANKISLKDYENLVKQGCQPQIGDVLLAKDGTVGRTAVVTKNNEYVVLSSLGIIHPMNGISSTFLKYSLDSMYLQEQMAAAMAGSALRRITISKINEFISLVPPLPEQLTIASYLDYKVGQIDDVIAEKEKMLKDLKVYRSSVISEAVTKGLDKNVPMKDSGIDCLGSVPKHWRVTRLKFIADNYDGTHFSPETREFGMPYITAGDIRGKGINYDSAKKISQEDYCRLVEQGCKIEKGDVLLVKDGATTGRVGLMTDEMECVALSSVAMLRPHDDIDSLFLMYYMESYSMQTQIVNSMAGSAMPRITLTKLNEFIVNVPPIKEQKVITSFIDDEVEQIDIITIEIEKEIEDLKSYKSSVITEAVTGKVDLREWNKQNVTA